MKRIKYVLLFLFLIPSIVFAADIKQDTINVSIKADGSATIVETWDVDRQNNNEFQKDFFNLSGVEISNFKIVNENEVELKRVDKLKKDNTNSFSEVKRDNSLSYKMNLDTSSVHKYTITYDVKGMIKKYKDNIYGIDFTFIGINYKLKINKVYITVTSEIPFYETNTALYGIGKKLDLKLDDGKIQLSNFNYNGKYNIRLVTKFTNVEYTNAVYVNKNFENAYASIKKENMYLSYVFNILSKGLVIIIMVIVIAIITLLIVTNIIIKKKNERDFPFITTLMNKTIDEYDKVDYFKDVPMVDLYKASFLSSYFNISKNRSDLVGAELLIWLYQGIIKINTEGIKPNIELLTNNIDTDNTLDRDLFLMINEASIHNKLDGSKLERFASNHYLRVMEWFNSGVSNVLSNEGKIGSVKKLTKVGKTYLELQDSLIDDANRLLGLKKYLLNFNQVPRDNELTENTYKYLLVYAELFGIGELVGKEILRKSPDNIYAMQLLQLEKIRHIYKNFYSKAFDSYKKINKNAITDIASYTIDFDENISKKSKK